MWGILDNPYNLKHAYDLAKKVNDIMPFLKRGEDILTYFRMFDYGSCAMTLQGQGTKRFWTDHAMHNGKLVTGVYHTFKAAFEETGFVWN
jgi:hypothetical protein